MDEMILRDLLKEKTLRDLVVINEKADLDRVVSTVESTETPDVVAYVPPHTLLLTTAMAYQNCQGELCKLIVSLNQLPCAGMAIKIGRFIGELEPQVVQVADELGFPLLQIPMYQTLGEVYHHMLAYIWDNENEDLLYALNIQKRFYNLVLQNASLNKLLSNLGMALKQPIFIFDLFGSLRGSSNATKQEERMAENSFSMMVGELLAQDETAAGEENKGVRDYSIYPIRAASYNTHYLMILETEKRMNTVSSFVLEQVLLIFGMYFYKDFYLCYNEIQQRESFWCRLTEQKKKDAGESQNLLLEGKELGIKKCSYYQVIIGRLSQMEGRRFHTPKFMNELETLSNSYWKAKASFHNGELKNGVDYIHHYKPQNILELLKSLSDNQIQDVCVQILKSLAYPQDEMSLELRKTLKTYLDCHCSIIETANLLFVHRNTIRYRIKRCEEILENDLRDPDYCFQVQLCLVFTDKC